ncbi:MAG: insulinase family protein [Clostridiales bacterium]|jgi:Zn-dependent M16 (insulinase) family peptidase|nr:insulinase family protein [Clostridiales bacterium]
MKQTAIFVLLLAITVPRLAFAQGFSEVSRTPSPQYDGHIVEYCHDKTGLKLIHIDNDDTEKAFVIGFRTPATDDTGVNHIIEHCLLNSKATPFSYLMNHTGATYLNAMTFSDFTLYALADRSETEYLELMRVYLDGIFFPTAMRSEDIFSREGWRVTDTGLNGTVFNEMKGVYCNDETYLSRAIYASLFPDTSYRYDSGGDPAFIPTLNYKDFVAAYARYYNPNNAIALAYGKQDIGKTLDLIDSRYLSKLTQNIKPPAPYVNQEAFDRTATVYSHYPLPDLAGANAPSSVALNFVTHERKNAVLSAQMELLAATLNDRGGYIFRDIVKKGWAERVNVEYNSMAYQCVLSVIAQNADPAKAKEINDAVRATLAKIASQGAQSVLSDVKKRYEYALASVKNEPRKGIEAGIEQVAAFVYGAQMDENAYREAISKTNNAFLKRAARDYLLDNNHSSVVVLTPKSAARAAGVIPNLSGESNAECYCDEEALISETVSIGDKEKDNQNKNNTITPGYEGEFSATSAFDRSNGDFLRNIPQAPHYTDEIISGARVIHTNINTHGISSLHMYLDASALPQELLGYAQILARMMADDSTLPQGANIGAASGYLSADRMGENGYTPRVHVVFRALDDDMDGLIKSAANAIDTSASFDKYAVYDYLARAKTYMDNDYENIMPQASVSARLNEAGRYECYTSGPQYYALLAGLLSDYANVWPTISENLANARHILAESDIVLSFSGSRAAYDRFINEAAPLFAIIKTQAKENLGKGESQRSAVKRDASANDQNDQLADRAPRRVVYDFLIPRPTGFPAPQSSTHVVAQGGVFEKYTGSMLVAASLINYDYLWGLVRDEGGAYGVRVSPRYDGVMLLSSYRDPQVEKTLTAYAGIADFLRKGQNVDDYNKIRSHVLAGWDEQLMPHNLWDYGARLELGIFDYDLFSRVRSEIIETKPEDLQFAAEIWEDIIHQGVIAIGGQLND